MDCLAKPALSKDDHFPSSGPKTQFLAEHVQGENIMPRNPSNQGESSKVKSFDTTVEGSGVPTPPTGRPGGTTGRFLVLLRQDAKSEGVSTIEKRTGKK